MNAKTTVTISFDGLPEKPNHHELTVALESQIQDAILSALSEVFDSGTRGIDFDLRVTELR